jgi:hypothetical protein
LYALRAGDCTAPATAAGTSSESLAYDKVVVTIPPGWTPNTPKQTEVVALRLLAPASYAYRPTTIDVQTFIGNFNRWTVHEIAVMWAKDNPDADTTVSDCAVAGGHAAIVRYAGRSHILSGNSYVVGYQILFLRKDTQDPNLTRMWGLLIEGTGGLDPSAVVDAKTVLGSWKWGP